MLRNVLKILISLITGMAFSASADAQNIPVNNQYFVNPYSLSPAMAGYDQKTHVYLGYREQWTSMPGSPVTAIASFVYPVNERIWLGAEVMNHTSSIFSNTYAQLSYTYRLPLAANQTLAFGIRGGIIQNTISLDDITVNDLNDPLLGSHNQLSGLSMNAGASLVYQYDHLTLGLYAPDLLEINDEYSADPSENTLNSGNRFWLFAMYQWQIHDKWQLKPSAVFRYTENTPFNFDLLGMLEYLGKYRFGMYYRTEATVGITLGGYLTDRINLNYSWGFENNGYTPYTAGTHEFTIGYQIKTDGRKNKRKKGKGSKYPDAILYDKKYRR